MIAKILGCGSPLVDLLAHVDEEFITTFVSGAKGGMAMVTPQEQESLISHITSKIQKAPGGSAGNTIFALSKMGLNCAMFGKLSDDPNGQYYKNSFEQVGGSSKCFITTCDAPTGSCLSLITPDAERTMRSNLGASLLLELKELDQIDFSQFDLVYIEGYMLFSKLFEPLLAKAKSFGCQIALDLGSFEVVSIFKEQLLRLIPQYVDIVFANKDEAVTLFGDLTWEKLVEELSNLCPLAVVKNGIEGSMAKRGGKTVFIPALRVDNPVDTTAAGDLYAAGFLKGISLNLSLEEAGKIASLVSSEVVKVVGSVLPDEVWAHVNQCIKDK